MSFSTRVIAFPAGKCPVKLQSTKKEDVIEWAEEIYSIGLRNNINYLPSAIIFFAQQFFNIFTEDYQTVCNHINATYNTGEREFQDLINKISIEKRISDKEKLDKKEKQILEENKKLKKQQQNKPVEKPTERPMEAPVAAAKKIVIRRK